MSSSYSAPTRREALSGSKGLGGIPSGLLRPETLGWRSTPRPIERFPAPALLLVSARR